MLASKISYRLILEVVVAPIAFAVVAAMFGDSQVPNTVPDCASARIAFPISDLRFHGSAFRFHISAFGARSSAFIVDMSDFISHISESILHIS